MASERILITLEVNAKGAVRQVDTVKRSIKDIAPATQKASTAMTGLGKSMAALGLAAVGIAAVMKAARSGFTLMKSSVNESIAQERTFKSLATALGVVGVAYESVEEDLNGLFTKLQETTKYGDTDSADALQRLTVVTGNYENALKLLQPTMDFATAMQIDMGTAARLAGQAASGMTGTLSRYGIILDEVTKKQLLAADAAGQAEIIANLLNEKFGGSAQADLDTYGAKIEQVGNYWGDFKEQLGDTLLAMTDVTGGMDTLIDSIKSLTEGVKMFGAGIAGTHGHGDGRDLVFGLHHFAAQFGHDHIK